MAILEWIYYLQPEDHQKIVFHRKPKVHTICKAIWYTPVRRGEKKKNSVGSPLSARADQGERYRYRTGLTDSKTGLQNTQSRTQQFTVIAGIRKTEVAV